MSGDIKLDPLLTEAHSASRRQRSIVFVAPAVMLSPGYKTQSRCRRPGKDHAVPQTLAFPHGLVVLHDGLVFVSSHELDEEVYREVAAECTTSCIVGTQV